MTPDFQSYFASIRTTYAKWWEYYTLTDATGKQRQSPEDSPFFDFGLTVQKVKREERDRQAEKRDRQTEEEVERFSVLDGLRKYADQQVLLVGRPGSGKSTALARLMLEEATNQQARIPVLVELRYWQGSIEQLIYDSLIRHEMPAEQVEAALKNALILFDGVNELPSEEARSQLSAFRRNHPKLPMIFTTRDLSIRGDLGIEKKLEMQPLSENQMRKFTRSYLPEQAEEMLRQLKDRLRELGETPLLLWMLCSLFRQTETIPENLGLVFREFTQGYEHNLKKDIVIESDRKLWKPVLQQLAWVMMQGKKPMEFRVAISREEAVKAIAQALNGKEDLAHRCLQDLLKYHLIQAGTNAEELEFRHQLIQEYYAAEALLKRLPILSDEELKYQYLNYLKWTEPVALMLAIEENELQVLRVLGLALDTDLRLGARLAGEIRQELQAQLIGKLSRLQVFRYWSLGWTRFKRKVKIPAWLEVRLLMKTKSETAAPALLNLVKHSDWHVRRNAAKALGRIGSESMIPVVLNLVKHSDWRMRRNAVEALGNIGSELAIPTLLKLVEDTNLIVRESAVEALGNIGSESAIPTLLKLVEDTNWRMRRNAARALGNIGSESAIPALLKLMEDTHSFIHWDAAGALGRIKSDLAVPTLLNLMRHSDRRVRRNAARALGHIGSEPAVPALLKLVKYSDWRVRESAAIALGNIGSESALPLLFTLIEDADRRVRESAAIALGNIGSESALPLLFTLIEDTDRNVRRNAVRALGDIGSESALPLLFTLIEDTDRNVRRNAAIALGTIGSEVAVSALLKLVRHFDWTVCERAAIALGNIGSEVAVSALLKLVRHFDWIVRDSAAIALGNIAKKQAQTIAQHLPYLLTLISTKSGEDAYRVILAIQENCKFYNYEIYQAHLQARKYDRQTPQNNDRSSPTIYQFPNVTEAKIFENVDLYYETPPKDPPS